MFKEWDYCTSSTAWAGKMAPLSAFLSFNTGYSVSFFTIVEVILKALSGDSSIGWLYPTSKGYKASTAFDQLQAYCFGRS